MGAGTYGRSPSKHIWGNLKALKFFKGFEGISVFEGI